MAAKKKTTGKKRSTLARAKAAASRGMKRAAKGARAVVKSAKGALSKRRSKSLAGRVSALEGNVAKLATATRAIGEKVAEHDQYLHALHHALGTRFGAPKGALPQLGSGAKSTAKRRRKAA
jgi:hypothetical protein